MTLHYHRLYQIFSLEASFSSEDMKYRSSVDRQKPPSQVYILTYPKTNSELSLIYSNNDKKQF